jgi:hypothetical protein
MPPRARRRRTVSQEREELEGRAGGDGELGRLADMIAELIHQRPVAAAPVPVIRDFKLPKYDGKSDVELFIEQFTVIGRTNQWQDAGALLHLKEALVDDARDCSRGATIEAVLDTLRLRFGVSRREARTKLSSIKKDNTTSLQEHSVELQRLVEIAYPDYTIRQKAEMALDTFTTTLGHVRLQQHMLAVDPVDLATAVKAGNSYLQLQATTSHSRSRAHVLQSLEEDNSDGEENAVSSNDQTVNVIATPVTSFETALLEMMKMLNVIAGKLDKPKGVYKKPWRPATPQMKGALICWGCGEVGHVKTRCTNPTGNVTPAQGNASRPQA